MIIRKIANLHFTNIIGFVLPFVIFFQIAFIFFPDIFFFFIPNSAWYKKFALLELITVPIFVLILFLYIFQNFKHSIYRKIYFLYGYLLGFIVGGSILSIIVLEDYKKNSILITLVNFFEFFQSQAILKFIYPIINSTHLYEGSIKAVVIGFLIASAFFYIVCVPVVSGILGLFYARLFRNNIENSRKI